ncbi:MAG: hydantoinase/oxoprolinase family protein, partial [Acholeplasmataceae bacterium]
KFSTRNPETENKIKELIKDDFNSITLGHELSGKLNFYRRINTCFLNESLKNNFILFSNYIEKSIKLLGINSEINILKADGGIMSLKAAKTYVVETIFSGPSASLMGMLSLKKYQEDSILIDIGGTTTDIFFLADGIPLFEPLGTEINKYKTLIRSIFSKSLPLGGNTGFIVENGILKIDFKSSNKPLSLGGKKITLTDVFNYLNNINVGDIDKSISGLKELSKQLNLDVNKTSKLIVNTFINLIKDKINNLINQINSKPIFTIKELLLNKQLKPNNITIIGAPALSLKPYFKDTFNLDVFVPTKYYDVTNAIGSALAITTTEVNLYANTYLGKLNISELNKTIKINKDFNLSNAKELAIKYLKDEVKNLGGIPKELEYEITLAEEYNMVKGFYTSGKNIRVKAQVKPGLIKGVRFYD